MKLKIVYAVSGYGCDCSRPFLEDTCAGGKFTDYACHSITFDTPELAREALEAAEIDSCCTCKHPLQIAPMLELQEHHE